MTEALPPTTPTADPSPGGPTTRQALVDRAVRSWKDQLIDLSGRNGLLYYRDLAVGTLDLDRADPVVRAQLLVGKTTRLSALFPEPGTLRDAARRCRTLSDKARENLEERGVDTLFLATDMATWTQPAGQAAVPSAPVVLSHVILKATGAAGEDFELEVAAAPEINPTLFYALEAEFGVKADIDAIRDEIVADEDDLATDTAQLSAAVAQAAVAVPGFAIRKRAVLGNFSYLKLPMVTDLSTNTLALEQHELVAAIAGDAAAQAAIRARKQTVDPRTLDEVMPSAEFLVLDADGSQQAAIESVVRGSDAVIQGPPGTGKSQTISNLIASSTAKGLRVLFVAEKRAAIDAVIGRLDRVGLSDLVLDLHGGVGSRKRLAQNLEAALQAARGAMPADATALQSSLASRREVLTAHANGVNAARDPWGVSLYGAQGRAMDATGPLLGSRLGPGVIDSLPDPRLHELKEELRSYMALGGTHLTPLANPWAWAGPVDAAAVEILSDHTLDLARDALPGLRAKAIAAAAQAAVPAPVTMAGIGILATSLASRERLAPVLDDAAFARAATLSPLLEPARLGGLRGAVAGMFNGAYKSALAEARNLVREPNPTPRRAADLVAQAAALQGAWATIDAVRPVPRIAGAAELEQAWARAATLTGALAASVPAPDPAATSPDVMAAWVGLLEADLPTLRKLPEMRGRRATLAAAGLDEVVREVAARGLTVDEALRAVDRAWGAGVVERVLARDPAVGGIDAVRLDLEAESFVQLDRQHIGINAARVKRAWAERAVRARDAYPEQDLVLSAEARKKSRHLSVRDLFTRAPDVLTAVKPCWAMSPLLVSQILPGDRQYFDLVIFDEASQILPADAIPSILRGKRAVVAGDGLQLPPTTFFASQTTLDREVEGEPLDGEGDALVQGFASLLDVADTLIRSDPLRWHYRSRDERLIAFSNLHIYRPAYRELTTFPAVVDDGCIRHVRVAPRLDGSDGVSSVEEVTAVVDLVLEHARTRPGESLGVIAMGIQHAERVSEALRQRRTQVPELDAFFAETAREPFFVKNLERVQGDERDAIILTIGYGRTSDGKLRQNFGPLNQQGGERRLNVAITRAKRRCALVSTFGSEDIDPDRSAAEGVRLLRAYIRYAESGGSDLGDVVVSRPELNGFERDVQAALAEMGIKAIPQLGTSGYYLDFALEHPDHPGRFVLAVECDGAAYHSAPNARERDRLRQQQLELIGWRFHRIWSTDWYRDRARESGRLRTAYEQAVAMADAALAPAMTAAAAAPVAPPAMPPPSMPVSQAEPRPVPAQPGSGPVAVVPAPSPGPGHASPFVATPAPSVSAPSPATATVPLPVGVPRGPKPRLGYYANIQALPPAVLDSVIRWIESDRQLRTHDELVAETMKELGFLRRGARIEATIGGGVARVRGGQASPLPPPAGQAAGARPQVAAPEAPMPVRRGSAPAISRYGSIDNVPERHLDGLVRWIASDGVERTLDEVIAEALPYLGFKRRGARIDAAIVASIRRVKRGWRPWG